MEDDLLTVDQLSVTLHINQRRVYAVDKVSFAIKRAQSFVLLGESGCGKSMTALSIIQLLPDTAHVNPDSHILFGGRDLLRLPEKRIRQMRGQQICMIFQEPMTALNPVLTIQQQLQEVCKRHLSSADQVHYDELIVHCLEEVGIRQAKRCLKNYPHQLSGGMQQRVMIAMVLLVKPALLIADEPTTALDVTTQGQIIRLLKQIQQKYGMAMLWITHDLSVAWQIADEIGVMYAGQLIEQRKRRCAERTLHSPIKLCPEFNPRSANDRGETTNDRCENERELYHPYSQKLLAAYPTIIQHKYLLQAIPGQVPALSEPIKACCFVQRCEHAFERCHNEIPDWQMLNEGTSVRCHLYDESFKIGLKSTQERQLLPTDKNDTSDTLLTVKDLTVYFSARHRFLHKNKQEVAAVEGVSFELRSGQTLALVGETGSGKTTVAKCIMQLIKPSAGQINYLGKDLALYDRTARAKEIQMILQNPDAAMNPRMMVRDILLEGIQAQKLREQDNDHFLQQLLAQVNLPADSLLRYPHEFSGGQRQRICIARALAVGPQVIICDEPTSALDVSVQAQILNLLKHLQQEHQLAYLFISHDLAVVSYLADMVAVMHQGKLVEYGPVQSIFNNPQHPYTQKLLEVNCSLD